MGMFYDEYPYDMTEEEYCTFLTLDDVEAMNVEEYLEAGCCLEDALEECGLLDDYWE